MTMTSGDTLGLTLLRNASSAPSVAENQIDVIFFF
jgi:hypothetical protein